MNAGWPWMVLENTIGNGWGMEIGFWIELILLRIYLLLWKIVVTGTTTTVKMAMGLLVGVSILLRVDLDFNDSVNFEGCGVCVCVVYLCTCVHCKRKGPVPPHPLESRLWNAVSRNTFGVNRAKKAS
mmetsp:Transcript_11151/g.16742  ORF Transcript_11151/g.16742 Transcript_11151/m.16742 type:complete len:127 (-) Transcript_11151:23-403(-)